MRICLKCGSEVTGKGKYCSDACKQAAYRNRTEATTVTTVTAPSTVTQPEQVLTEAMLDSLPQGVVRPTGQPGPGFMQRVEWQGSAAYARVIYDLLTMTVDELEERGQSVPNWKYHQAPTAKAQAQGIAT